MKSLTVRLWKVCLESSTSQVNLDLMSLHSLAIPGASRAHDLPVIAKHCCVVLHLHLQTHGPDISKVKGTWYPNSKAKRRSNHHDIDHLTRRCVRDQMSCGGYGYDLRRCTAGKIIFWNKVMVVIFELI